MKKDKRIIWVVAGLILVTVAIVFLVFSDSRIIGNTKDKNGCLISAGYEWDDSMNICWRSWEFNTNQLKAIKIAISSVSYPLTILSVEVLGETGNFNVYLQRNDNLEERIIELRDWKITHSKQKHYCENVYGMCPVIYAKVCASDGLTYDNGCRACLAGADFWYEGECI